MKKNTYIRCIALVFILLSLICVSVGCSKSSSLLGTWYPTESSTAPSGYPDYMIIQENGVCTVDGANGVWEDENGKLTIRASNAFESVVCTYTYKLNGSILTLVNISDKKLEEVTYKK